MLSRPLPPFFSPFLSHTFPTNTPAPLRHTSDTNVVSTSFWGEKICHGPLPSSHVPAPLFSPPPLISKSSEMSPPRSLPGPNMLGTRPSSLGAPASARRAARASLVARRLQHRRSRASRRAVGVALRGARPLVDARDRVRGRRVRADSRRQFRHRWQGHAWPAAASPPAACLDRGEARAGGERAVEGCQLVWWAGGSRW